MTVPSHTIVADSDNHKITISREDTTIVVDPGARAVLESETKSGSWRVRVKLDPEVSDEVWSIVQRFLTTIQEDVAWVNENLTGRYSLEAEGLCRWTFTFEEESDAVGFNTRADRRTLK